MTTREMSEATGATPRQLQHWDERGYFVPQRRGRPSGRWYPREYGESQIRAGKLLLRLVRGGSGSGRKAVAVAKTVRRNLRHVAALGDGLNRRWFCFDRHTLKLLLATDDAEAFAAFVCGQHEEVENGFILIELKPFEGGDNGTGKKAGNRLGTDATGK